MTPGGGVPVARVSRRAASAREGAPAGGRRPLPPGAWLLPVLIAAVPAAVLLGAEPRTTDLAAATFRADLVDREGLVAWNGSWYGGHHTLAYSVLFPPLAALAGPSAAGALGAVAAAGAFGALAHVHLGEGARPGSWWFALGTGSMLFTGRMPFALGVAVGLVALLALARGRPWLAAGLAVGCALASPVAALFLALAGVATALAGVLERSGGAPTSRHAGGILLATGALAPPVVLALAFPEGGTQPFLWGSLLPVLIFSALFGALLPSDARALRIGAALYALGALAAFSLPTPVGNNWSRLGPLVGGPLLACTLAGGRRPWAWTALGRAAHGRITAGRGAARAASGLLGVALAALAAWQWAAAVRDTAQAARDPSAQAGYYAPLLRFLDGTASPADRVEIPFTASHWEAAEVAPRHALARGWQRQLDRARNRLFYDAALTDRAYAAWLRENAVRFVAVPDAPLDHSAEAERALALRDPPYLVPRWRSEHWRVYAVVPSPPAAVSERGAGIRVRDLSSADAVALEAARPGSAVLRVRFSPYWRLRGGCVEPAGEWTRVTLLRPGPARLEIAVSPARIFGRGRRCG